MEFEQYKEILDKQLQLLIEMQEAETSLGAKLDLAEKIKDFVSLAFALGFAQNVPDEP